MTRERHAKGSARGEVSQRSRKRAMADTLSTQSVQPTIRRYTHKFSNATPRQALPPPFAAILVQTQRLLVTVARCCFVLALCVHTAVGSACCANRAPHKELPTVCAPPPRREGDERDDAAQAASAAKCAAHPDDAAGHEKGWLAVQPSSAAAQNVSPSEPTEGSPTDLAHPEQRPEPFAPISWPGCGELQSAPRCHRHHR